MRPLLLTLYRPGEAFEHCGERAEGWILPAVLFWALFLATAAIPIQFLPLTLVQKIVSYFVTQFLGAVFPAAVAGSLFAFSRMAKHQPTYLAMFEMVGLAYFPWRLLMFVMSVAIVVTAPNRAALDFHNLIPSNLAAYANPATTTPPMRALLASADVIDLGEVLMLAYGYAKVCKTRIIYGLFVVGLLWMLYVSAKFIGTLTPGSL